MAGKTEKSTKVIVKCKYCEWRIFDKVTPTTGIIEVKCPRCGKVSEVDLSLRRLIKYRMRWINYSATDFKKGNDN